MNDGLIVTTMETIPMRFFSLPKAWIFPFALALSACGGGGTDAGSAAPVPLSSSARALAVAGSSGCAASVGANSGYACTLTSSLPGTVSWSLNGAPVGMVVQAATGSLHWTPLSNQLGSYTIEAVATSGAQTETITLTLVVGVGAADPAGLHVAPNGDDKNDGSAARPLKTLARAVKLVTPGKTIYLRGGEYRNTEYGKDWGSRTLGSLAQISVAGTASAPITLRPLGNEYVRLLSDVNGLAFKSAHHWTVQGLEIAGSAASLDLSVVMPLWWDDVGGRISGRGIASNSSDHLVIDNCIVHDFPSTGITITGGEYLTVNNSIVYNNAWWTTGGVHGISAASLVTSSDATAQEQTVRFTGNMAFANQSLVISHVFSKGAVSLAVDEGNGLHLQNTDGGFRGRALVENNLMLLNGKGGLGVNTMDGITIRNNGFYRNARVVNTGELALQSSSAADIGGNLFQPRTDRSTIRDYSKLYAGFGSNVTTGALADDYGAASLTLLPAVFASAATGDFSAATGVSAGMGVSGVELQRMRAKLAEYGIVPTEPTQVVDDAYLAAMKATIFASWPSSYSTLVLNDRATGYSYSYAQRCHYPAAPGSTPCP